MIRKMTFGKHKGSPVLWVIAEHIGYIMWCLENIEWFKLNDDEQKFYDWRAIAIKKYHPTRMTFPVETMYKHVKDKKALEELKTPIINFGGEIDSIPNTELNSLLREAGVFMNKNLVTRDDLYGSPLDLLSLARRAAGMVNNMSDEETRDMLECDVQPPLPVPFF